MWEEKTSPEEHPAGCSHRHGTRVGFAPWFAALAVWFITWSLCFHTRKRTEIAVCPFQCPSGDTSFSFALVWTRIYIWFVAFRLVCDEAVRCNFKYVWFFSSFLLSALITQSISRVRLKWALYIKYHEPTSDVNWHCLNKNWIELKILISFSL